MMSYATMERSFRALEIPEIGFSALLSSKMTTLFYIRPRGSGRVTLDALIGGGCRSDLDGNLLYSNVES
jgi:hypothetical protein